MGARLGFEVVGVGGYGGEAVAVEAIAVDFLVCVVSGFPVKNGEIWVGDTYLLESAVVSSKSFFLRGFLRFRHIRTGGVCIRKSGDTRVDEKAGVDHACSEVK